MNSGFRVALTLFALPAFSATVAAAPHRYDHVVIVIEENTDYAQVLGDRLLGICFSPRRAGNGSGVGRCRGVRGSGGSEGRKNGE